jgi:tetratricopeptide (TPR) repeat protein
VKITFKLKAWSVIAAVSLVAWIGFLALINPQSQPVSEQLAEFAGGAETDDIWHRAVLFHGVEDYEHSAKLYDTAIERDDSSSMFYLYRGRLKYDLKEYDAAIAEYDLALEADPASSWALNARGVAKFYKGDKAGSIADLDAALAMDPNYMGPEANKAVIQRLEGDLEGALDTFVALRARDTDRVSGINILNNLAQIYFELGKYPDSIEALTTIIMHYPANFQSLKNRAEVYRKAGREEEARLDEKRYRELVIEYQAYAKDLNATK